MKMYSRIALFSLGLAVTQAQQTTTVSITAPASTTAAAQTTAVTDCHTHSAEYLCVNGASQEVRIDVTPTGEMPAQYTNCHSHGSEQYCVDPEGEDVAVLALEEEADATSSGSNSQCHYHAGVEHCEAESSSTDATDCHEHDGDIACTYQGEEYMLDPTPTAPFPATLTDCHDHDGTTFCLDAAGEEYALLGADDENESCHFHAGVEHCTGGGAVSCGLTERDYDVGLRIGSIFIVLVTSSIGVYGPIFINKFMKARNSALSFNILMIVKQFGTGVIIATAFIHLYTHAELLFSNECIPELGYEATTSAIVMAGIFICFLIDYLGHRFVASRGPTNREIRELPTNQRANHQHVHAKDEQSPAGRSDGSSQEPRDAFLAMDHHHGHGGSNNTLSVAVMEAGIIFHSILIGLTLVVAGDSFYRTLLVVIIFHQFFEGLALGARIALLPGKIFPHKFFMALAFALITPIGMAIGIGVLNTFNGNNPATVIAFGTLDALSAGVLVWVGLVDMWARDWVIEGGELLTSGLLKTLGAGLALVTGMVLMGVLGKWA